MSDSDGEGSANAAAAGGQKKDFMYKVKAFKRRTFHAVQKATKKLEETKDAEFDEMYKDFVEVDQKAQHLARSVDKFILAQKAFAQASSDLADDILDMYNNTPTPEIKNLVVMLNHVSHNLSDQIRPPLDDTWNIHVQTPVNKMLERFRGIKEDEERRKRYLDDYDHYRHKKRTLEEDPKQDKVAAKLRETEQKLNEAGNKFFTMNERLSARLRIANEKKGAMLNEPLLNIVEVQHTFFNEGWKEINKIMIASRDDVVQKRAVEEARELSQADFAANNKVPAGIPAASVPTFSPDRVPSHGSPSSQAGSVTPAAPPPAAPAAAGDKKVKAMFAYEATADTELDMKEDDIIKVIREDDSGWWQGEIDGRVGWFPFNYVEEL
mmetsp:Transcript_25603/g.60830  ORF Transcript_25603/g.60830 Transcript_25603/m.60830 type:complete len:380 (-) Transcript_25603:406-1545(-)